MWPRQVYSESGGVGTIAIHVIKLVQNVTNQRLGKKMKGSENETVITHYFDCWIWTIHSNTPSVSIQLQ